MLQTHDIRETRVYQDALKEGIEKGISITIEKLIVKKMSATEIANLLEMDVELIRKVMSATQSEPE